MPAPSAQIVKGTPPDILALPIKMVDVAKQAGLDFQVHLPSKTWIDIQQTIGQGAAFFDFDGDGWVDILLIGPRPQLFRNLTNGKFAKITVGLEALPELPYMGVGVGDYDRDGYPDLFLSAYQGGVLLHNEHGKKLRDVTTQAGIDVHHGWTSAVSFADLDGDGWQDLIIGHYLDYDRKKHKVCQCRGYDVECGPLAYGAEKPQVYRNLGTGKFAEVTKEWGFDTSSGKNLGVLTVDLDGDGQVEVLFANDQAPGDLFARRGKRYENLGLASGTAYNRLGTLRAGMGIDVADYDRDGRLDLTIMGMSYQGASLFHNVGKLQYRDVAGEKGVKVVTFPWFSFGSLFFDVDNNGWLDLAIANGHSDAKAEVAFNSKLKEPLQLLYNKDGAFYDLTSKLVAQNINILGRGLCSADYDHDGRVDLLAIDSDGSPLLMHNETQRAGHYLSIRLRDGADGQGPGGEKLVRGEGYGATVTTTIEGKKTIASCHADGSYVSASEPRVHLGLGAQTSVPELVVLWPSGNHERFGPFNADQRIEILEGTGTKVAAETQGRP